MKTALFDRAGAGIASK